MKPFSTLALLLSASFALLFLPACTALNTAQAGGSQQSYDAEAEKVGAMAKSGRLTRKEANTEMVSIARTYFPNDQLLIGTWQDIVELSARLEQGEITKEKYNDLIDLRWERFGSANRQRHEAAQAQASQQQRSGAIGGFLGGMANSMNRQYPRPVTCSSTAMPGVVTTNCQ